MKAKPALLKILFWEESPAPSSLKTGLARAFALSTIENVGGTNALKEANEFDLVVFYGTPPIQLKQLPSGLPVVVLFLRKNTAQQALPNVTFLQADDIHINALVSIILLRHECSKNESQLNETTDRLTTAGRVTNDILWDWNLQTGYLYYNSAGWTKIIGRDTHKGEITFDDWLKFVHKDDRRYVRDEFEKIIADKSTLTFEVDYRMISKSGHIYVTERGYVERNSNGVAQRLLGSTQDVTAKKLAEEELRKISAVVRETTYGAFITDTDCRITWVNKAFTTLTGFTLNEIKGRVTYELLFDKEHSPQDCKDFEMRITAARPFEQDIPIKCKSGSFLWSRVNCQPQYDIRDNPSGFFGIIADVSAQKSAEEKLIQNEKKFRVLVENIQDGLALIDADGKVMELFSGQKILGYTLEDFKTGTVRENVHPDYREAVDCALKKVLQHPDVPSKVEFRVKRKNGKYTWIEAIFYNLLNEDPLYAILANFRETLESKHAEQLLRQSEKKYRNLFNNNPLAIFVWDPSTLRILEANEAASIQYGYEIEELKKMTLKSLIHPDMEERMNAVARSSATNSNFRTSYLTKHLDKEGRIMHMEVAFHPIDYFGTRSSMAIIKNITEQVGLERRLSKERELRQQEITQAAVTAQEQERLHIGRELHDNINQILATVRLYIEYALSNQAMHDQLLKSAKELVLSAVNEIRNLSKSLLPPSVGEKGLAASLDDLFNSIRKINKYSFNTNWAMEEERLPENLKLTIFRIVQEQLNNILKHARASKIDATITMNNGQLILRMRDDGRGFDPAINAKGVGLKNIRSRAELHKGQMKLKTVEGRGTELMVTFHLEH